MRCFRPVREVWKTRAYCHGRAHGNDRLLPQPDRRLLALQSAKLPAPRGPRSESGPEIAAKPCSQPRSSLYCLVMGDHRSRPGLQAFLRIAAWVGLMLAGWLAWSNAAAAHPGHHHPADIASNSVPASVAAAMSPSSGSPSINSDVGQPVAGIPAPAIASPSLPHATGLAVSQAAVGLSASADGMTAGKTAMNGDGAGGACPCNGTCGHCGCASCCMAVLADVSPAPAVPEPSRAFGGSPSSRLDGRPVAPMTRPPAARAHA